MEKLNLEGVIDLHVHTAPDVRPRYMDDIEFTHAASRAGMSAVLLKSHHTLTSDRARLAEKHVSGIHVFGGLVLNDAVGGLKSDCCGGSIGNERTRNLDAYTNSREPPTIFWC